MYYSTSCKTHVKIPHPPIVDSPASLLDTFAIPKDKFPKSLGGGRSVTKRTGNEIANCISVIYSFICAKPIVY